MTRAFGNAVAGGTAGGPGEPALVGGASLLAAAALLTALRRRTGRKHAA